MKSNDKWYEPQDPTPEQRLAMENFQASKEAEQQKLDNEKAIVAAVLNCILNPPQRIIPRGFGNLKPLGGSILHPFEKDVDGGARYEGDQT